MLRAGNSNLVLAKTHLSLCRHRRIVIGALARPAWAQGIFVRGSTDCGVWVKARTENRSSLLEYYILGLLDGIVVGRKVEFWRPQGTPVSDDAIYLWMDGYCRDNPLKSIVTGTMVLFEERSGVPAN